MKYETRTDPIKGKKVKPKRTKANLPRLEDLAMPIYKAEVDIAANTYHTTNAAATSVVMNDPGPWIGPPAGGFVGGFTTGGTPMPVIPPELEEDRERLKRLEDKVDKILQVLEAWLPELS